MHATIAAAAIDPAKTYTVATTDFVAQAAVPGGVDTHQDARDAIEAWLKTKPGALSRLLAVRRARRVGLDGGHSRCVGSSRAGLPARSLKSLKENSASRGGLARKTLPIAESPPPISTVTQSYPQACRARSLPG